MIPTPQRQSTATTGRVDPGWPPVVQARVKEVLNLRTELTAAQKRAVEVDMLDARKPDLLMDVGRVQSALGRAYVNLAKELVYNISRRREHGDS